MGLNSKNGKWVLTGSARKQMEDGGTITEFLEALDSP
jgi:hypothetical protein